MSVAATLTTKTAQEQIALHGVRVTGKVLGTHQHITVEQTYVNLEDEAIEAQYTFPLPAKAAVCEFEVRTGDRTLTGEIDEITNNAKLYDASVEQGDGAFLLEQQRPDIFTAWVGNIKPQQAATIRVTYLAPIDVVERQMRLALPTTVSPRYVTNSGGRDPLSTSIDGIAVNPPHVLHVPYGMEMTLDLEPGMPIRIVDSPSHGVIVSQLDPDRHQRGKRVSLRDELTAMDRDIVIEVELDRAMVPSGRCAATEDGETFAAITFIPDFDEIASPAPTETVFLVDTSGSMGGSSLQEAKNALELCLRSLNHGDRFNIISFNSYFESFGSRAVSYDADSLARALKWVRDLQSTGGTELFAPLQELLQTEPSVGSVRQVILLTDGQVANEAAVIDLASQSRSQNRFFTFAIGHAASQHLTGGIACATCGAQESIVPGERIEEKVLRTFARLGTPVVENIRVDWGQGVEDVTQAPQPITSVFEGDPLTVFARLRGTPQEVTLSCERAGTPHQWKVPVEMVTDQTQLSRSWAREAIQELAYAFDTPLDRPRVKRRSSREQMIDLSCRYQVLCEHTSFLAIETRAVEERTDGNPAHRRVPVQLTAGWGGVETVGAGAFGAVEPMFGFASHGLAQRRAIRRNTGLQESSHHLHLSPGGSEADFVEGLFDGDPLAPVSLLLALQQADGDFGWNQQARDLLEELTGEGAKVEKRMRAEVTAAVDRGDDDALVYTLLVLAMLTHHYGQAKVIWKRASNKARGWLDGQLVTQDWQDLLSINIFA